METLSLTVTSSACSLSTKEPRGFEPVREPPKILVFSSELGFFQEKKKKYEALRNRQMNYYKLLQCSSKLDFLLPGLFYHSGRAEVGFKLLF